jgi:autotransporter-associated beta strand protein
LSGVNAYTGKTVVSGGTLTLDGANRLSASSALVIGNGTLKLADSGGPNGQTFTSLSLTDNATLDLGLSSLSFNTLGTIATGKDLTVLDWSASTSSQYAFRVLGDESANSLFQALVNGTTIDGLAATSHFDGTYTDVAPVPLPGALALLLSGLGMFCGFGVRRQQRVSAG